MNKKVAIFAIVTSVLALVSPAEAQQSNKFPRIGYLGGSSSGSSSKPGPGLEAFRQGLKDLGYIEGKNIMVEYRYHGGRLDRIPSLLAELMQLNVDLLAVQNNPAISAAKQITKTIPIVMLSASIDPVAAGYVESLARPGGNVTGLTSLGRDLSAKRAELLQEAVPKMSRLGIIWDSAGPGPIVAFKEYRRAAQTLMLDLQSFEVRSPDPDFEGVFQAAKKGLRDALIIVGNPLIGSHQRRIIELAAQYRLPSMYDEKRYVESGGLISYGANDSDLHRRAATYVDKILKGAKPADLPVEQPTKFELVVNLKTARALGIKIPQMFLLRADKVIE